MLEDMPMVVYYDKNRENSLRIPPIYEKTVILDADSELGKILVGAQ